MAAPAMQILEMRATGPYRRDALALAHFARAGDLTPVMILQEPDEAIPDL
jgi:hypothetical protein